ncbi:MAG: helix-turn-helix domain-containing protein, partial [Betaproteobacteria bacterium]
AMAVLRGYDWPGNARQLRNVIEWLLIMVNGSMDQTITKKMLPPEVLSQSPKSVNLDKDTEIMSMPLRDARELFETEYLKSQVDRFDGNVSKTARFVGMERSALHRKLKSLGIITS